MQWLGPTSAGIYDFPLLTLIELLDRMQQRRTGAMDNDLIFVLV